MIYNEIKNKLENTKSIVSDLIQKAKQNNIQQIEIFASYAMGDEISIEKNDIGTSTHSEDINYGIRVIENNCQGFVTTNNEESLYESILDARAIARSLNTPDECMELPECSDIKPLDGLYHTEIDQVDFEHLMKFASYILEERNTKFPLVNIDNGGISLAKGFKLVANSKGILASESGASISANFFGMAVDGDDIGSFDYDSATGRTLESFKKNLEHAFHSFGDKCMGALKAQSIESFKGDVIVPPDSIFDFIGDLISSLTGTQIRRKRSKFGDKLGNQVASALLSIYEDPHIPCFSGSTSFDREGVPTQTKEIVNNGVLQNFFYNHFEARKAGLKASKGNATGGSSSTPSCGPKQLQILPGKSHISEMLNPTEKTILVSRFSGSSDSVSGDFSGTVKGGFLLNKGEKIPIKEVSLSGNIYELLNRIVDISRERKLLASSSHVPWIRFSEVDITGANEFSN